ncbi:PopZ family protein [Wolbachia endosymbiont (group B) of Gerris lacustris]|uniref:PopZ family protein n=1 Tax=Wolbachia endosymbiont (group B) of Gerris lacustris TaxID=3066159 RepID=UPI0033419AE5
MSDNQSVKDILEDIKKAISGKNPSGDRAEIIDEDNEVLCLEEEYPEDIEEKENSEEENNCQSEKMNNQFNSHSYNSEEKNLYNNIQMSSNKVSYQEQSNEHLVLKENMEEIKTLLEKMQSELRHKQQKRADLTVEELVVSLLKPQLSEWLNKYLHALVKEVVEKELKDIINNK